MKKTIFSRILKTNLLTILIGIFILTSFQLLFINYYISHENERSLRESSMRIVGDIRSYASIEAFKHSINGFMAAKGADVILTDNSGKILISQQSQRFDKNDVYYVDKQYIEYDEDDSDGGKDKKEDDVVIGTLGGVYNKAMFTLRTPIYYDDVKLGTLFLSMPVEEMRRIRHRVSSLSLYGFAIVTLISIAMSYLLSKRLSRPIKEIGKSANEFAKGDFGARVELDKVDATTVEIAELAGSFNDMAQELENFEDVRNNFISDVSHELRTPMTTISGFVDGILDGTVPPEKQSEYLEIVRDEVKRLSKLVNSFLAVARQESSPHNEPNMVNFELDEMIRLVIIGFENRLDEKKADVEVNFAGEKCVAFADKDSIKQVLTNLVDNAIKFMPERGKITISVENGKNHNYEISVRNTGSGISEEAQKFIFERFYKEDKSRSENKTGTGIGLYIVKSIIKAHNQSIWVNSDGSEYTEFVFTLEKGKSHKTHENG